MGAHVAGSLSDMVVEGRDGIERVVHVDVRIRREVRFSEVASEDRRAGKAVAVNVTHLLLQVRSTTIQETRTFYLSSSPLACTGKACN